MGSSILPRVNTLVKIPGNPLSLEIEYAIRDIVLPALELEKQGHKILKLNIGDPNKYDFDTPQFIKDAVTDAMNRGMNGYSPSLPTHAPLAVRDHQEDTMRQAARKGPSLFDEDSYVRTGMNGSQM